MIDVKYVLPFKHLGQWLSLDCKSSMFVCYRKISQKKRGEQKLYSDKGLPLTGHVTTPSAKGHLKPHPQSSPVTLLPHIGHGP